MSDTTYRDLPAGDDRGTTDSLRWVEMRDTAVLLDCSPVAVLTRAIRSGTRFAEKRLAGHGRRHRRKMATTGTLSMLSDYQLRDIGLTRSVIHQQALGLFDRE